MWIVTGGRWCIKKSPSVIDLRRWHVALWNFFTLLIKFEFFSFKINFFGELRKRTLRNLKKTTHFENCLPLLKFLGFRKTFQLLTPSGQNPYIFILVCGRPNFLWFRGISSNFLYWLSPRSFHKMPLSLSNCFRVWNKIILKRNFSEAAIAYCDLLPSYPSRLDLESWRPVFNLKNFLNCFFENSRNICTYINYIFSDLM